MKSLFEWLHYTNAELFGFVSYLYIFSLIIGMIFSIKFKRERE